MAELEPSLQARAEAAGDRLVAKSRDTFAMPSLQPDQDIISGSRWGLVPLPLVPLPSISRIEAENLVAREMEESRQIAEKFGFTVGGTPETERARENLKQLLMRMISRRYVVVDRE